MFGLSRGQVQPIGLDIGHDSVKMLQVEVNGDDISVIAAASLPFSEQAKTNPDLRMTAAAEMIRSMLRKGGFCGRGVVAAIPREILHVKNLRLPLMPAAELEAAVKFEAKNIFPFETAQACVHYLHAGEVRQGADVRQEVIVLAARNEDISNHLEKLHRSGAVIESLDVEACALFRSFERFIRRREDEQDVHVLLDIGARRSQVVIGKGREMSFFKSIEIGGHHLHEAVSRKLGITFDEARALRRRLTEAGDPIDGKRDSVRQAVFDATRTLMEDLGREISLCLRYYSVTFRGHRPQRVRLVGGEATDPQMQTLLNAMLTVPIEPGRPLFSVDTSRMTGVSHGGTDMQSLATMGEWTVAFGLGMKFTTGHYGPLDGKPRDPNARTESVSAEGQGVRAEVVDMNKALHAADAKARAVEPIRNSSGDPAVHAVGSGVPYQESANA